MKYFTRAGLDWQLKEEVRRMVRFAPLDLRQSMRTLGPFDVVIGGTDYSLRVCGGSMIDRMPFSGVLGVIWVTLVEMLPEE